MKSKNFAARRYAVARSRSAAGAILSCAKKTEKVFNRIMITN